MAKRTISADPATTKAYEHARTQDITTIWERHEAMQPICAFGDLGLCCTICYMGPCRIDPFSKEDIRGACGAGRDTISARNYTRAVAAGTAAHSDHARGICHTLLEAASGSAPDYKVIDIEKLKTIGAELGLKTEDVSYADLALQLGKRLLENFGKSEGTVDFVKRAPKGQQDKWEAAGVIPRAVDREVVECMHRTHEGVDADPKSLILQAIRCALADGWGGSMMATELQDILFGSPKPIRSKVNLGVLKEGCVNVVVHGHEPVLSEMLAIAAREKEIIDYAKSKGAEGLTLSGICCTANEILMRQGYPVAGNFLQQELAISTGAVDAMIVDVQCVMPGLAQIAEHFHTHLVTTSDKARIPGVNHFDFHEEKALDCARELLKDAADSFAKRDKSLVDIPQESMDLVAGFTAENTFHHLGGTFRGTYRPLNDAIMSGRLRGVVGVVGCNNVKINHDHNHKVMVEELLKNDVLVVQTGCSALACAKAGWLRPEAASEMAGKGLQEICEAVGIPPVLHMGSCVDNSRILIACCEMVKEGGIGEDISQLPVAAAAPEAMSEKAVAIGLYAVGSGITTFYTPAPRVLGAPAVLDYLTNSMEQDFGAHWVFEDNPLTAARGIIEHLDKKRAALKLDPMMYNPDVARSA
ncbi:carbon-monoxide dehydrogenase catalytic subunit [candidate division LCP-89 bacterium B3_LCP]|uniref:Carbon monoxide dehydrogenase n=1 Tax=candidate division LCP-89 bacterium B3_LCP TaxID=2012998 RepID=A0A532UPJ4_UNCL8|nr:MAG: carbon-monoxide dehydrogenase catalytic subunit [candidate division LCP-89 bacterium B3_LCP]